MKDELRLADGVNPNRGVLEIFLGDAWTRVCTVKTGSDLSQTAAAVCRHLGYPDAFFARAYNLSRGGKKANISYVIDGKGNDASSFSNKRAKCGSELLISCRSGLTQSVRVRLSSSSSRSPTQGYLEVWFRGKWERACADRIYKRDLLANASCRQLGYHRGSARPRGFGAQNSISLRCDTNSFDECRFRIRFFCRCFVWITCYYSKLQVQLFDTSDEIEETEGKVQVYFEGKWTIVCNDEWDMNEAEVVCRQMGFKNAVSASSRRSKSTISNINRCSVKVLCKGSERSVEECERFHMLSRSTAVVVCKKKECKPTNITIF